MPSMIHDIAWNDDFDVSIQEGPSGSKEELGIKGHWPRMLKLKPEVKDRLVQWLSHEIEAFNLERAPVLEDWKTWQELFWAEPASKEKNFPFRKSANIVVPLAAIAAEAIHARIMNTLFSVEPFWTIRARSKDWIKAAKPFESYLQSEVESGETLNIYNFCNESTMELVKLGVCVGKTGYERLTKKSFRIVGDEEEEIYVTIKNGAVTERVPLGNFIMRLSETDPQTAPLVGEKHEITWSQIKSYVQDGRMDKEAAEKIKHNYQQIRMSSEPNDGGDLQKKIEELAHVEPTWNETFEFYELWCTFDVDEDGWDEEIVVDFHKETGEFLAIRYNWYEEDLHRPYRINRFIPIEGTWLGYGICKQVHQFQEEATTIHRQRLDNATLANMTQIAIKKGGDYRPGEPIFPGKMWFMDDPYKDIREFKLSEIYPSSYNNEEVINNYFEKRSGANEVILGMPQTGTPGTATGDLTRLAEGNKRFDLVLKNTKRWLSLIGIDVISNMQVFGNQEAHWATEGEDGIWVEHVLRMPAALVRRGAIVDLTVTDSISNRETEQRQWMTLFQIITGYYNTVLQLAQLFGPEVFSQVAQRALAASDEALKRLLETFAIPDSDRFSLVEDINSVNGSDGSSPGGSVGSPLGGATNGNGQNAPVNRLGNIPTSPGGAPNSPSLS